MTTSLDQWQDLTGEVQDPLEQTNELEVDDSEEDYSVTTRHTLATNPMIKIVACGSGVLVVVLGVLAIFIGASSSGTAAKKQQQQQIAGVPEQQKSTLSDSDRKMVEDILANDTFNRQQQRQKLLAQRRQQQKKAPAQTPAPPTGSNTVKAPKVIYRNTSAPPQAPVQRAAPAPQPIRQFAIQRPKNVAAAPKEIEDPNAGYFTAPFVASSKSPKTEKRPILKLTKSPGFDKNKSLSATQPPTSYIPPVQVASNSPKIPQPEKSFGTLSGNLTNPYVNQVATASTSGGLMVPADTAVKAEIVNRVSWIPENTGLAKGKVLRLKLKDDIKSSSGQNVASKGDIALGTVTQATEQGLITVSLTKIGEKFIQQGVVEIHQNGDPLLQAKLHKKGGNNGFLKTAVDIGVGAGQAWAKNLANPTNQTSITNGNQTFLSSSGGRNNTVASLVEGATGKIGEHIKSSTEGPTQTSIGVFRFDGNVQLYFTREVQL